MKTPSLIKLSNVRLMNVKFWNGQKFEPRDEVCVHIQNGIVPSEGFVTPVVVIVELPV